jgi:hypothetical protein
MNAVRRPAPGFLAAVFSAIALLQAATIQAITKDNAYYPVSAKSPNLRPAPPILFERACEATLPGLPGEEPPRPDAGGNAVRVVTSKGIFSVGVSDCAVNSTGPAPADPGSLSAPGAIRPDTVAGPAAGQMQGREPPPPRWAGRLKPGSLRGPLVAGPAGLVAVFARDGAVYGRLLSGGHMLWRHVERHRVSRPGVSLGDYLLVASDASRTLDALRWSDGSSAGLFRLDSENAGFVSAPIILHGRVMILAVQSPREETRLLAVVPKMPGVATKPPIK